jgi:sugar lactone lactonase YvrE
VDSWRDVAGTVAPIGLNVLIWTTLLGYVVARLKWPARRGLRAWIFPFTFAAVITIIAVIWTSVVSAGSMHRRQQNVDHERQYALPYTGLRDPQGVAVDAAGNLYVADLGPNQVLKLAPGSSTPTALPFTGLNLSANMLSDVAVDTAGNVYIGDSRNNRALKLVAGSSTQTVLPFTGLDDPGGVAVDTAGNVYVVDRGNNRVLKLAAGSGTQTVLPSTGDADLDGNVAVDTAGTVYTNVNTQCGSHCFDNYVLRLAAGSDTWSELPSAGNEGLMAVDGAGNVYVITAGDAAGVMRLAPGSSNWTHVPGVSSDFRQPGGLAVDAHGNVYVTENLGDPWSGTGQGLVLKLPAS